MYYLIICIHINMVHKWQQGFKPLTTSLSPINCGTQHGAEPAMTQTARDRWCINEVHAGAAIATAQAVVGSCFKTTCLWANYWLVVWNSRDCPMVPAPAVVPLLILGTFVVSCEPWHVPSPWPLPAILQVTECRLWHISGVLIPLMRHTTWFRMLTRWSFICQGS